MSTFNFCVEVVSMDLPHIEFRPNANGQDSHDNGVKWDLGTDAFLTAVVRVPNGATINRARLFVNLPGREDQVRFELVRPVKGTVNTAPAVASLDSPMGGGEQTLTLPVSQVVDPSCFYRLTVRALSGSPSFHGRDVRYAIQSNVFGLLRAAAVQLCRRPSIGCEIQHLMSILRLKARRDFIRTRLPWDFEQHGLTLTDF
jgi:hypothetical protein